MSLLKVQIFCILLLTASSDSFGLKIKVVEEIHAESQALKFSKSVQGKPSYGCLKFIADSQRCIFSDYRNNFSLNILICILFVAFCALLSVLCVLCIAFCALHSVRCILCIAFCLLRSVCCFLCIAIKNDKNLRLILFKSN